jgi:dipeptidyl aminopeptidase/acylaminoacyl peptidase
MKLLSPVLNTLLTAVSHRFRLFRFRSDSCLFGLAIIAAIPGQAQEKLNRAEAFSRYFETPFVQISPDGKKLASAVGNPLFNRLVILDAGKIEPIALKTSVRNVESAMWHDERTLLVVARDMMDVRQLYRLDLDTDSVTSLTNFQVNSSREAKELTILPVPARNGDELYAWSTGYDELARLYRVDVRTGTSELIFSFNHPNDKAFPIGGGNYINEEWDGDTYWLRRYHAGKNKPEDLAKFHASDARQVRAFGLGANQKSVYLTAHKDGMQGVHSFDVDAGTIGPLLLGDSRYDIAAIPMVLPQTGEIIGITYDRDLPAAHYFDEPIRTIMAGVARYKKDQFCTVTDASRARAKLIIFCRAANLPGEYYIFDSARNTLDGIYSQAEWLLDMDLSPVRPISYKARDGLTIEGYLTTPRRGRAAKPLIVMPHGGPDVRDTWHYHPWVQYFASLGYTVLQPNYRMSTGYGHAFHTKGWKEVGYAIQDDIFDGIAWAQSQGYGRDGNVCIVGASFGAYASMRAATTQPAMFKCVIAAAGFYDIHTLLKADAKRSFYPLMKQLYGDPVADEARLHAASALAAVDRLTAPVLVVHGEWDKRVSVKEARALVARLSERKKPHEVLIRNDEGHSFHKASTRRLLFETMGAFLQRHLPGDTARAEEAGGGSSGAVAQQ